MSDDIINDPDFSKNKSILRKYDAKSTGEITNRVTVTYGLAKELEDGSISSEVTWNQDFNRLIKNKWLMKKYAMGQKYFILQKITTTKLEPIFTLKVK